MDPSTNGSPPSPDADGPTVVLGGGSCRSGRGVPSRSGAGHDVWSVNMDDSHLEDAGQALAMAESVELVT